MNDSIEEMLQRWEEEPTPQLSLQLAEEYRRQGELEEGVVILEQALRLHPHHVAARVAHGRFLLDLGRTETAGQMLEAVVEEDPTHLVANKLLVGLYLRTDRFKDARDRLDLYKLLNESDPEIESLEAQLGPGGTAAFPPTAVDAAGRVFLLAGSPPPPDLQGLVAEAGREGRLHSRSGVAASEGPFGDLWRDVDREGYMRALGVEGIFPVFVPAEVAVAAQVAAEPAVEVQQPWSETAAEAEPVPEDALEEEAEPEPAAEVVEEVSDRAAGATATLAQLYLDQGHLQEATQAFEEVLAREPDHEAARRGLSEARRRMDDSLIAVSSAEGEGEDDIPTVRERKARVLREYLSRLRATGGRH